MAKQAEYVSDPEDGLRAEVIGGWALEKHERLRKYVDICRATRAGYDRSGSAYLDLFCGPGKAQVRSTGQVVDGGAVAAWKTSVEGGAPFTSMHIADLDPLNVSACETRLRDLGCKRIYTYVGKAAATVHEVVRALPRSGLNLAFLDPYGLMPLPFSVMETLAKVRRMDLIIHVSQMDLQRNIRLYASDERLEAFCPGWRDSVDLNQKDTIVRAALFAAWQARLESLDYTVSGVERVTSDKNVPFYWLVGASRHKLGNKFWREIRQVQPQRELFT